MGNGNDGQVQGGGAIVSRIDSDLFLIYNDDGQVVRRDQTRVSVDYEFADDIVICSESREQAEANLNRWRNTLDRREMKVSRNKRRW